MRVNWAAVGVSGVVYWLLQAAWFTAFAKPWMAGLRMSSEELAYYQAHPNFIPYLIALVCNLLLAFIIARVLALGGVWGLIRGFRIGLLVGLVAALAMLTEMHFELKPWQFIVVSAGAPVAGCALMGMVLGAWKPRSVVAEAAASAA
jgi:hypothetical protein